MKLIWAQGRNEVHFWGDIYGLYKTGIFTDFMSSVDKLTQQQPPALFFVPSYTALPG